MRLTRFRTGCIQYVHWTTSTSFTWRKLELRRGESLVKNVYFLLTDLSYNVRHIRQNDSSSDELLITNNSVYIVEAWEAVMKHGLPGHICFQLFKKGLGTSKGG